VMKKLVELDGSFELAFENFDWSSDTFKKTGKYIPDGGLDALKEHDAILFGAVGAPGELESNRKSHSLLTRNQMYLTIFLFGASD